MKTFIAVKTIEAQRHRGTEAQTEPVCHLELVEGLEFYQQVLRTYKSQGIELPCTQKAVELIEKQLGSL